MAMNTDQQVGAFDRGVREGLRMAEAEIARLTRERDALLVCAPKDVECPVCAALLRWSTGGYLFVP